MNINMIVACTTNGIIGLNGSIPWHISNDLKRFKELTMNSVVIMGRKTYESLPNDLPGRLKIVLSGNKDYIATGDTKVFDNTIDLLCYLNEVVHCKECFVIGGESVYREFLPITDKLYMTKIHTKFNKGDAFFPIDQIKLWSDISTDLVLYNHNDPDWPHDGDVKMAYEFLEFVPPSIDHLSKWSNVL